ncbi:hypothetical protein FALBO_1154 [Fusarium albosuccineum]|uniref:Heterokaryon incompatibility domain-containing protein n=1 Tax=Fusarium albosuccineum TaxID=1237068 RepID=A0A8H4LPF1_9HYPO|nr:hypothetical protein FALBO_1154 [Fusarium albosuccineum]
MSTVSNGVTDKLPVPPTSSETAGKWCQICRNLDRRCPIEVDKRRRELLLEESNHKAPDDEKLLQLQRDANQVRSSAEKGCRYCAVVLQIFEFYERQFSLYKSFAIALSPRANPQIWLSKPAPVGGSPRVQIYTPLGHPPAWSHLRPVPEISPGPRSPEALSFMRECLDACLQHHDGCQETGQVMLTRVIEAGAPGDDRVRLIESKNACSNRYVALSYCWGKDAVFTTIKSNFQQVMSGIPVSILPKTLQDAIYVTRQLEVPYLWIDAICIIQDDLADWEKESATMGNVYKEALFTLAAASSSSSNQGFLDERPKSTDFSTEWINEDGIPTILKARLDPTTSQTIWTSSKFPLNNRGWTLQEQVLSSRIVIFGDVEIQWRCPSSHRCECRGIDSWTKHWSRVSLDTNSSLEDTHIFWHDLVSKQYSVRQLTKGSDKLPAVSGIASTIKQRTQSDYIAGLWVDNILRDLCWCTKYRPSAPLSVENCNSTPAAPLDTPEYRAPTFSWASVDGDLAYWDPCQCGDDDGWEPKAECIDVSAKVPGRNPFGQVSDGKLQLKGSIAPCFLSIRVRQQKYRRWILNGNEERIADVDEDLCGFYYQGPDGTAQLSTSRHTSAVMHAGASSSEVSSESTSRLPAYLFLLGKVKETCNQNLIHYYLILGNSFRDPSCYERIGQYMDEISTMEGMEDEPGPVSEEVSFTEATVTII